MNEQLKEHFAYLGTFAPSPATFDLEAMADIWDIDIDEASNIANLLVDCQLIDRINSRYSISETNQQLALELLD